MVVFRERRETAKKLHGNWSCRDLQLGLDDLATASISPSLYNLYERVARRKP